MRRLLFAFLVLVSGSAHARPFVTLRDDGTVATTKPSNNFDFVQIENVVLDAYAASGQPQPDVLSVWTTFPYAGGNIQTQFFPMNSDTKGIGLETQYGGDGTIHDIPGGPRSMLLHNNVLEMPARAAVQNTPLEGFATYLFLLEFTHNWGPAVQLPTAPADELIGFDFHWSFWMDAGSPAGGNRWKDNGDGTFSTLPLTPSTIAYSNLDLYVMGLAKPEEVQPFGILQNVVPPTDVLDPFNKKPYSKQSFPWFGATPFRVTATRKAITIEDVIAKNGPRSPAYGAAPTRWKVGLVLLARKDDTADQIAAAEATFAPIADAIAPAFAKATQGRGTLEIVTETAASTADMGSADGGAPPSMDGGCGVTGSRAADARSGCLVLVVGLLLARARQSRYARRRSTAA